MFTTVVAPFVAGSNGEGGVFSLKSTQWVKKLLVVAGPFVVGSVYHVTMVRPQMARAMHVLIVACM